MIRKLSVLLQLVKRFKKCNYFRNFHRGIENLFTEIKVVSHLELNIVIYKSNNK